MNTIRRHVLTQLPTRLRAGLKAACETYNDTDEYNSERESIRDALDNGLHWSDTPQGHDFFYTLSCRYHTVQARRRPITRIEPLPCHHTPTTS